MTWMCLDQFAVLQDGDPVAQAQGLVQIVGDEDDGLVQFRLQSQQLVLHFMADERIQGGERLVHQQDLGVRGQRAGQTHALLHAAGKLVGILGLETGQADLLQPVARALVALGPAHALHRQPVGGVVQHRAVRQQAEALEHHAHLALAEAFQFARLQADHVHPVDQDLTGAGLDQAVEVPDQRRLARPRQPHDDVDVAFLDRQADVAQAQGVAAAFQQGFLGQAFAGGGQPAVRMRTENLVDVADFDLAHVTAP